MRCLAMAQRALTDEEGAGDEASLDHARRKLRTAHQAMVSMAQMLERAMDTPATASDFYASATTISQTITLAGQRLGDLAESNQVTVTTSVSAPVAELNAGPLGPVIENGLRNAIEACAEAESPLRRVAINARTTANKELLISISDTGTGVPADIQPGRSGRPGGHGIGLDLMRRIAAEIGGAVQLSNASCGPGALLQIRIPLRSLDRK